MLDGTVDQLDRRYVYEEMLHPGPRKVNRPAWYGIRTTLGFSETLWVYTEYATGEKELYDPSNDPHQLENLIRRPAYDDVRSRLRRMLHEGVNRTGPRAVQPPAHRPLSRWTPPAQEASLRPVRSRLEGSAAGPEPSTTASP